MYTYFINCLYKYETEISDEIIFDPKFTSNVKIVSTLS